MTQRVDIRVAVPEDAFVMSQADEQIFSEPWSEKAFLESILSDREIVLAAFDCESSELAGYAVVSYIFDEANINRIAVLGKHRGNGTGISMLCEIEKLLPDEVTVYNLEVRRSNIPATNMYTRSGYKTVGIRERFYRAPDEDALLMTKRKGD